MYESPIEKIYRDIQSQIVKQDEERLIYSVNQAVGYNVDKDELLKALQYDRHQYEKGYDDAKERYKSRWIPVSERLPEESGRYLAYIVNKQYAQYIMTCDYFVDGYWKWFPDDECASDNVVAWMPLPEEPYKAESEV